MFVVFLLAQVSPAEEEAPKSPQGVELLFPENNGAAVKDKKKNAKAEKAAKRQAALLKKLKAIEKGGDINAVDKKGQTALMLAAASNNRLVVSWLVAKGADVTLKSKKGKTAYDLTKSKRIRDLLRVCLDEKKPLDEEQEKVLSRLLYEGTDKDAIGRHLTELVVASRHWDDHFYGDGTAPKALSRMQRFVGDLRGVKTFPLRTPESTAFLVRHGGSSPIPEELVEVESLTLRLLLALGEDAKANDNERKMQVALKIGSATDIKSLLNEDSSLAKNTKLYNYIAGSTSMQTLLDAGVDAKSEWEDEATKKKTNFIALAMKNFDAGMLRVLLKAGVTPPDSTEDALFYFQNVKDAEDQEYALALLTAGGDVKAYMLARTLHSSMGGIVEGIRGLLTPLHLAAAWSMPKVAKALLDAGADPNALSKEGTITPLMEAAYAEFAGPDCTRRADVVKVLLDAGADARTKDSNGNNALSYVLSGGHRFGLWEGLDGATYRVSPEAEADILRATELLIQAGAEAPKDALLSDLRDELSPAGKEKLALMLLAHGADPKAVDESGWTTLMRVGIYGGKIAKSLLDAGVDPTVTVQSDEQKLSALSLAMDAGAADVVEQLKKKGIEPGELTSISNPQSMKKLLDLGARIPKNMADMLLQDTTGEHSHGPRKTYEDYVQIIRLLKKYGYSPTLEGITVDRLSLKDIVNTSDALRALLKEGASPNALTQSGEPFLLAVCSKTWNGSPVDVLLDAGVKTDVKNKDGKTALQIAREKKNEELVKLLEEHGVKE